MWTLNNLWHPISNQPGDNKPLLLETIHSDYSRSYTIAQFRDGRIKLGGCHECRLKLFNRWCYIEDLLVDTSCSDAVDNENEKDDSEKLKQDAQEKDDSILDKWNKIRLSNCN